MSMSTVITAVRARMATASTKTFPGMRVAGRVTPCIVYNVDISHTMHFPATAGTKSHYMVTVQATCIADTLDAALDVADDLADAFLGGPFTHTGCKLVAQEMTFSTGAEVPDDGQQDAERTVTATITLQAKET